MNSPCVHRVNDVLRQSKKNNLVPSVSPVTGSPLDSHRTMFNYRMLIIHAHARERKKREEKSKVDRVQKEQPSII